MKNEERRMKTIPLCRESKGVLSEADEEGSDVFGEGRDESMSGAAAELQANSSFFIPHSSFTYYLGLGTNLGDKQQNLQRAVELIGGRIGEVVSLSSFYVTAPWGFSSENSFLNAAVCVRTGLPPLEVLQVTQRLEQELGRTHKSVDGVYSDRLIDIDLLLCFDADGTLVRIQTPQLVIPHPLMQEREFVMNPLREIAPEVVRQLPFSE